MWRPNRGLDHLCSSGDYNQLPPVGNTPYYKGGPGKEGSVDKARKVVLSNLWISNEEEDWESTILIMNQVVRQSEDEADYKEFLNHIRTGAMNRVDYKWMISKCHDTLEPNIVTDFDNVIHICPTWKTANKTSYDYLQKYLTEPIVILRAQMGTINKF